MSDGSTERALQPGDVVDGFKVTRLVAEGAMGRVYLALDERLGRQVALKFVKSGLLDEKGLHRFREEARTTARFNHPHIVTVYSAGAFEGRPWLALEYLDGETLRERLDRGALVVVDALRIALATAEALREAHRHGVVHADLKPENVLLPRDGRVRVVDFGLARLVGTEATAGSGTPSYMAPERWQGEAPRPSMDVWALGVILHEAIEGRRPFTDPELASLAFSPRKLTLGARVLDSPAAAVVADCLEPDANARPSAEALVGRLEKLLEGKALVEGRAPFRGLEPMGELDALDFHGRADELDAAVERLRTEGLLTLAGPIAVGKTSFIHAGLVPRLRKTEPWDVVAVRPGARPLAQLAAALGCEVSALTSSPDGLAVQLRRLSAKGPRVLLVVDQAEELVGAPLDDRAALLQALVRSTPPDAPWRVVVVVRTDALEAFVGTELAGPLKTALVLRPFGRAALEEALNAPLERLDYAIDDPELPGDLATELDGQPAPLPLFQFACHALWARRDVGWRMLLRREYEAMGGVVGALATHAERVVSMLLPDERQMARALLLRLLAPDGGRQRRTRAELLQGLPAEAAPALDRLMEQRLVVSGRHQETGLPLFELSHELLVAAWPTLARWIDETREVRALEVDLEQAARLWDKRGRPAEETWSRASLAEVAERLEQGNVTLAATPRAFLESGLAWHQRQARQRWMRAASLAVAVVAALVVGSSFVRRVKTLERRVSDQAELLALASGDVGRFTLVLAPFDWDPERLEATPVPAGTLTGFEWEVFGAAGNPPVKGPRLEAPRLHRAGGAPDGQGRWVEEVELPSEPVFLEISGRGEGCGPVDIYLPNPPGFSERRASPAALVVPVPSCAASRAGVVVFPRADGRSFEVRPREATARSE